MGGREGGWERGMGEGRRIRHKEMIAEEEFYNTFATTPMIQMSDLILHPGIMICNVGEPGTACLH